MDAPCYDCEFKAPYIMPNNKKVWDFFLLVQTQWRVGMSRTGLDYSAVFKLAECMKIEMTKIFFKKLQVLEFDTLIEDAERFEKSSHK